MTNRDDIRDQFSPLLDGELSPEERAHVEAALSGDAELLRELDAIKRVDDLYRALPAESAPDGFEQAVRDRLRQPRAVVAPAAPRRAAYRRYWTAGLAAAAVVVVGVGVVMLNAGRAAPERFALSKNTAATQPSPAPLMQADRVAPAAESAASSEGPVERFYQSAPAESKVEASSVERERAAAPPVPALRAQKEADRSDSAQAAPERPVSNERAKAGRETAGPARELPMVGATARKLERDEAAPQAGPEGDTHLDALGYTGKTMADEERTAGPGGTDTGMAIAQTAPAEVAPATPPPPAAAPAAAPPVSADGVVAERMKKVDAPKDAVANGIFDTRTVGTRAFTLRDGVWYEAGYTDQKLTVLERGSAAAQELIGKHAELRGLLGLDRPAVFRIDDDWYRLNAPAP